LCFGVLVVILERVEKVRLKSDEGELWGGAEFKD
jgi:hypothetical protein